MLHPVIKVFVCFITTYFRIPFSSTIHFPATACTSHPSVVLLGAYHACACLHTLIAPITSSSHHFAALLHTINFFPTTLNVPFHIVLRCTHASQQLIALHFWSYLLGTIAAFLSLLLDLLSIFTIFYRRGRILS